MTDSILLGLSAFPDVETARKIAHQLVTERFAACANILPGIESVYWWKEKVETGNEILVFFKLSVDRQPDFEKKLRSLHPYDVPEIVFLEIDSALPDYLQWVLESCGRS